jgi:hypothetical protein
MSKRSGEMKDNKKPIQKRKKDNKTLSQKAKIGGKFFLTEDNKKEGTEDQDSDT